MTRHLLVAGTVTALIMVLLVWVTRLLNLWLDLAFTLADGRFAVPIIIAPLVLVIFAFVFILVHAHQPGDPHVK